MLFKIIGRQDVALEGGNPLPPPRTQRIASLQSVRTQRIASLQSVRTQERASLIGLL